MYEQRRCHRAQSAVLTTEMSLMIYLEAIGTRAAEQDACEASCKQERNMYEHLSHQGPFPESRSALQSERLRFHSCFRQQVTA